MWHEIGHKIDLLLGLTDKAGHTYDAEFKHVLDRKYPDGFLNHYRLDELQPEGIAEFLKEYMHDRAEAVSPACAGMIPSVSARLPRMSCEPRMRGDDPRLAAPDKLGSM